MNTPKRRVHEDGSVTFIVRFRHGPNTNKAGTGRLQTSETFSTEKQAIEFSKWLDALGPQGALDRLYAGDQAASVPSLDTVAADHIAHLEGASEGHRIKMRRLWDRTWSPRIGATRADQISRDMLVRALDDLARNGRAPGRGYSEKSLYNQRGLLYGVLTRCVDQEYLHRNPGAKLSLPQVTVAIDADDDEGAEMVCLTTPEWWRIYAAMTPHYQPFVRFLVGTAARWGEAVAMRVGDVDLHGDTVRIRRALKWSPDGNHVIGPPKTKKSKRTVVLPPEVAADLEDLVAGRGARELLFPAPRGGMIAHRTFWSDHWRPALWRAQRCDEHMVEGCRCGTAHPSRCKVHDTPPPPCGCAGTLKQSPRIHDLRHTHASWLLARNTPIHVVQARLGHESIQTTVDTYSHLLPDAQLMAAEAASLAFAGGPAGQTWQLPRIDSLPDAAVLELAAAVQREAERRGLSAGPVRKQIEA